MLHQHCRVSLPHPNPLFFLLSRMRSPEHRVRDFTLRRRSNSSRTEVPPLLLPRQEHQQQHISMPNLPNQFPSPSCTPVAGTPSPLCIVAEQPELFRFKCTSHRYTDDTNSSHFKWNNPLVCRVSARCNHGLTRSKQVYLARRRVYSRTAPHQPLIHSILNIITNHFKLKVINKHC
jgi:hypothetical protein